MELAKRIARPTNEKIKKITSSKQVYDLLRYECINQNIEMFFVINLDIKNNIIKTSKIATGGKTKIALDMNDIYREAIKMGASSIILVHNHPSGDTKPSKADINFTYKAIEASKILDIDLIDHIVISDKEYTSLRETGIFE